MVKQLIKCLIRCRFFLTSKAGATKKIRLIFEEYQWLGNEIDSTVGRKPCRVPAMLGIDEDMRDWSFFMILEHNVIVNRFMTVMVESLARKEIPENLPVKDVKRDVMPSADPGPEQVTAFCQSVETYLSMMEGEKTLRGTPRYRHPIFGMLNAHGWHCMMALHLEVHLPQAKCVLETIQSGASGT